MGTAWTVYRAWRNLPVTALAVGWARWHGASFTLGPDLFLECSGMPAGSFGRGGTTVGNAWLYGELGGPRRRRHELRHADQYALLGTIPFLLLYGLNAAVTRNQPHRNVFEHWAGLIDGGYRRRPETTGTPELTGPGGTRAGAPRRASRRRPPRLR